MLSLSDNTPRYLLDKNRMVDTVVFTALFSIFLFVVTLPFSKGFLSMMGSIEAFNFCIVVYVFALCIVILSKRLLYLRGKRRDLSFSSYILWNIAEVAVISLAYTLVVMFGARKGYLDPYQNISLVFVMSFVYCLLSLGIPYLVAGMYFDIQDKDNIIRMTNFADVVSDEPVPAAEERKITLFDNNGSLKFSVSATNLYYIESDDNYIKVWYMDADQTLKQYMLRCRLKTVEDSFRDSSLVRCHRKYIVNIAKVRVLSKERGGYFLDMGTDLIEPIPVTRTYEEAVLSKFNSR